MKALRYIAYLFYSYYSKGPRRAIAYFSAIMAITFMAWIHILIAVLLLYGKKYFFPGDKHLADKNYLKILLLLLPLAVVFYLSIKEKRLQEIKERMAYKYDIEYNHRVLLFIYFFLAFAALMLIAVVS
ncbi:MAG: hypothetical protein WCF67_00405 [Chitinophagaceae bacterium]